MAKYDYHEDLEETFYSSKRFKKIKQLVYEDINCFSKYQILKLRLYKHYTNLCEYIIKHNKILKQKYEEKKCNISIDKQKFDKINNKSVFDYYTNYLKNDNTIFKVSWKSLGYSTFLMIIGKIISDPIICYNFICNLF